MLAAFDNAPLGTDGEPREIFWEIHGESLVAAQSITAIVDRIENSYYHVEFVF